MLPFRLNIFVPSGAGHYFIDQNILRSKFSFAAYVSKYVLKRSPTATTQEGTTSLLFPKLEDAQIINLNNTIRGTAKVCAADDLELSFSGNYDEIEFLDACYSSNPNIDHLGDRQHNNAPEPMPIMSSRMQGPVKLEQPGFHNFSPATALSTHTPLSLLSSLPYDGMNDMYHNTNTKIQVPFVQIQSHPLPQTYFNQEDLSTQSHFALNMIGLNPHFDFNDFGGSHANVDTLSIYASSSESNASPLDDMFFKGSVNQRSMKEVNFEQPSLNMRKRKVEDSLSPRTSTDYQSDSFMIRSINLYEPKFEGVKKAKVESYSDFVRPADNEIRGHADEFKYSCDQCDSSFKVKSYLTRHMRKHNNANAFVCPFFEPNELLADSGSGTRCHHTGGFSRRDTYKTHLKALHFIYPPGTKSSERNSTRGRCAGCFEVFQSNADWLKDHIEGGQCKGIVDRNSSVVIKQEYES